MEGINQHPICKDVRVNLLAARRATIDRNRVAVSSCFSMNRNRVTVSPCCHHKVRLRVTVNCVECGSAGSHNILLIGPPGSGKTMLAKRLPTILPTLGLKRRPGLAKIHSSCRTDWPRRRLVSEPSRFALRITPSACWLVRQRRGPASGEVSLAHRPAFSFLDELPPGSIAAFWKYCASRWRIKKLRLAALQCR